MAVLGAILGRHQQREGSAVKALQDNLIRLGHLSEADRRGGDGKFGPRTEAAVRAFQQAMNLTPGGVADIATQRALALIITGPAVGRDTGEHLLTRALQDRLVAIGGMDRARIGAHVGIFGPYTEASLKRFQASRKIEQTGKLGPTTYRALFDQAARDAGPEHARFPGHHRFILPIRNMRTTRLNGTLHGRSWGHGGDRHHHNVFHGYRDPGTGDALDIYAPVGTKVYAIADGTITRLRGTGGDREHVYLSGPGWSATYAHIHAGHEFGATLKQGDVVGTLRPLGSGAHLHFELWLGSHAVHARSPEKLRERMLAELDAN